MSLFKKHISHPYVKNDTKELKIVKSCKITILEKKQNEYCGIRGLSLRLCQSTLRCGLCAVFRLACSVVFIASGPCNGFSFDHISILNQFISLSLGKNLQILVYKICTDKCFCRHPLPSSLLHS